MFIPFPVLARSHCIDYASRLLQTFTENAQILQFKLSEMTAHM